MFLRGRLGHSRLTMLMQRLRVVRRLICQQHLFAYFAYGALLVDRLLTLSRADTGQAKLSIDIVDIPELAEEIAEQLGVLAEERQQSIDVHFEIVPKWIGDRVVLRQALLNLVDNAIKYSPVGGKIAVRVAQTGDGTIIDVSDTGSGIPAELQSRIFDRFYRVDKARSRQNGGTGLGLAIAKWAVEANGGSLTLQPANGAGSCFRITLPQTATSTTIAAHTAAASH